MRISDWSSDVCSSDLIDVQETPIQQVLLNAIARQTFDPSVPPCGQQAISLSGLAPCLRGECGGIGQVGTQLAHYLEAGLVVLVALDKAQLKKDRKSTRLNSSH